MNRFLILTLTCCTVVACGHSDEELAAALGKQKAELMAANQSKVDEMKVAQDQVLADRDALIGGLQDEVTKLGGDLKTVRGVVASRTAELAGTKSALSGAKKELSATNDELQKLRKLREEAEKEAAQFRALASKLKAMIDAGELEVVMRDGRINLKLPDNILFPSGSKRLKKGGREALAKVAEALKSVTDRDFLIAGHTDNVPLKKGMRFKDNWQLSTERAVEVVRLMVKNGVPEDQLVAAGYGEHDPIAPNDTREGRAQNRRLEIVLMPKIENIEL